MSILQHFLEESKSDKKFDETRIGNLRFGALKVSADNEAVFLKLSNQFDCFTWKYSRTHWKLANFGGDWISGSSDPNCFRKQRSKSALKIRLASFVSDKRPFFSSFGLELEKWLDHQPFTGMQIWKKFAFCSNPIAHPAATAATLMACIGDWLYTSQETSYSPDEAIKLLESLGGV